MFLRVFFILRRRKNHPRMPYFFATSNTLETH
nr:MAG TPA: hypothetical protein [Caudoviricetes sp.]